MNSTINDTGGSGVTVEHVLIGIACGLVLLLSLLGNTLVVFVILRYKRLQNATNYILLSLAIADLTVSILVMIPSMIYDIRKKWTFGDLFCKFYNSFDITCCTASILHLLLVAVDRYVAIFKPLSYRNYVRKLHVFAMVALVWLLSACISFIPIFSGLNAISFTTTLNNETTTATFKMNNSVVSDDGKCQIEANLPYAIVSSSLSFYIPLILMTIVYAQIFVVARRQAAAIAETDYHHYYHLNNNNNNNTSNGHHRKSDELPTLNSSNNNNNNHLTINSTNLVKSYSCNTIETNNLETNRRLLKIKQSDAKRKRRTKDTKAIKTLGIIMGIFILCWLPFFVMYIYVAACPECGLNLIVERLITWVGYVNSFINPIVYALTNRDFRKAYIATLNSIVNLLCPCLLKLHKKRKKLLGNMIQNHMHVNNNNYASRQDLNKKASDAPPIILHQDLQSASRCCCCCLRKASSGRNERSNGGGNNKTLANFRLNSDEDLNVNNEDEQVNMLNTITALAAVTTAGMVNGDAATGGGHLNVLDNGNKKFYSFATLLQPTRVAVEEEELNDTNKTVLSTIADNAAAAAAETSDEQIIEQTTNDMNRSLSKYESYCKFRLFFQKNRQKQERRQQQQQQREEEEEEGEPLRPIYRF